MCGRKRDPKVDAQLEENKVEAEAAKETAQEDLAAAKADALEQAKEDLPKDQTVTEGQLKRQAENIDPEMTGLFRNRYKRSSAGRNRRSLLAAKTGQGFYSRFGNRFGM